MNNCYGKVSMTGTQGKTREVNVIRKGSMLNRSTSGEVAGGINSKMSATVTGKPVVAQEQKLPHTEKPMSHDDLELYMFESTMASQLDQFENRRGRGRGRNRHRNRGDADYGRPNRRYK